MLYQFQLLRSFRTTDVSRVVALAFVAVVAVISFLL